MPGRDDALSWDGDEDPTLVVGDTVAPEIDSEDAATDPAASPPAEAVEPEPVDTTAVAAGSTDVSGLPEGWTPVGNAGTAVAAGDEGSVAAAVGDPATPAPLGNAALVTLGVLGGIYLLYAIGWLIGGLRLQGRYQVLVTDAMYQGALWLATAAPLIWLATTIFATRRAPAWVRWAWLAAGVVLLIPWVFVMIGAVGR